MAMWIASAAREFAHSHPSRDGGRKFRGCEITDNQRFSVGLQERVCASAEGFRSEERNQDIRVKI